MVVKTDFRRTADTNQKFNVHLELGRAYESEGNFDAAVNEYQKSIDACKRGGSFVGGIKISKEQEAESHRRMAGRSTGSGNSGRPRPITARRSPRAPNDAKVWNDAGYSYYLQRRLADAERSLKTAAKLDPHNPRVQTNLGLALAAAGKTDEALAALTKAGGPAAGHANLGYLLASRARRKPPASIIRPRSGSNRSWPRLARPWPASTNQDTRSTQMAAIPSRPAARPTAAFNASRRPRESHPNRRNPPCPRTQPDRTNAEEDTNRTRTCTARRRTIMAPVPQTTTRGRAAGWASGYSDT